MLLHLYSRCISALSFWSPSEWSDPSLRNKSQLHFDHEHLRGLGCSDLSSWSSGPPFPQATVTPRAATSSSILLVCFARTQGQHPGFGTSTPSQHQLWEMRHLGSPAAWPTHLWSLRVGTRHHITAQRQEWEPRKGWWRLDTSCLHPARKTWISGLQQVGSRSTEVHLGSLGRCYQAFSIIQNGSSMGTWGGGDQYYIPRT